MKCVRTIKVTISSVRKCVAQGKLPCALTFYSFIQVKSSKNTIRILKKKERKLSQTNHITFLGDISRNRVVASYTVASFRTQYVFEGFVYLQELFSAGCSQWTFCLSLFFIQFSNSIIAPDAGAFQGVGEWEAKSKTSGNHSNVSSPRYIWGGFLGKEGRWMNV